MKNRLLIVGLLWCELSAAQIPQFKVTMTPAVYETLYTRDIFSNVYLPGPFAYNDTTWPEAEIRFKGNSTRYYPKKSFRHRFAAANPFRGVRQINLNSMYTDKSFLREHLAWQIYGDIGALAPKASHAWFSINGEPKGLYLYVDKVDRYFLQVRGRTVAPMYDTDDYYSLSDLTVQPDSLLQLYYPKEIGSSSDYSDLRALIEAINYAHDSAFASVVDTLFDMNSVYNWLACNIVMMMGDTYNKNYLLYRDTSRVNRQWTIIPWDYDLSFGRTGDQSIPYPASLLNDGFVYTFPPLSGPSNVLKDRLWNTPLLRERLRQRVDTLLTTTFTETNMHAWIDSVATPLHIAVLSDPQKWGTYQDFLDNIQTLKYYVTARRNYLLKTFINPSSGQYNDVTLPISQLNTPYHFVSYDGRQIATMQFSSFNGLDSVRVRVYPDSTPPALNNPGDYRYIRRWMQVTPYPSTATFTATLQWMYLDLAITNTEVSPGIQDERLLKAHWYDGVSWNNVTATVNPFANTATLETVTESMCGPTRHFALLLPQTYTQTWFRQPFFYWQRWYDVKFRSSLEGYLLGEHGTFLRSSDGGVSWTEHAIGMNLPFHKLALRGPDTLLAVGETGSLYLSSDDGSSWTRMTTGTTANLYSIHFPGPATGWIGGDGIILRSTDGGATWEQVLSDTSRNIFLAAGFGSNSAFVAGKNGVAFATNNGGTTWIPRALGTSRTAHALHTHGMSSLWIVGDSGLVLHSSNEGNTWSDVSVTTTIPLRGIATVSEQEVYVSGNSGKLFYTTNGGMTWFAQHTADWHDLNAVAFVDSTHGFAVGNGGTILATTSPGTTTGVGPVAEIVNEFRLLQNYPNPFNPRTIISAQLPVSSHATIKVYDILGQEISTLVSTYLDAGSHDVVWDAHNVASGVYFYRLMTRTSEGGVLFQQTKKMMVIK